MNFRSSTAASGHGYGNRDGDSTVIVVVLAVCAVVVGIDLFEGMPTSWTLSEGPFVILFGLVLLWLSTRLADS